MEKAGSNAVYTLCTSHDVSPKFCSDISGFLHEVPTRCIQNNIKYWPFLPYMTENHTEKLICLLYVAMIHTA